METYSFEKLLLKSAFCCMAADGNIDEREINIIRLLCEQSSLFDKMEFTNEINKLIVSINANRYEFIKSYFESLEQTNFSEEQKLSILDISLNTIRADEIIEYKEIKMVKNISHRLKISNEKILASFSDIDFLLEEDITSDNKWDRLTNELLDKSFYPALKLIEP
jgi:uncharacterized tellurite resistance protein B-like protein